jgi:hypothetical protein
MSSASLKVPIGPAAAWAANDNGKAQKDKTAKTLK